MGRLWWIRLRGRARVLDDGEERDRDLAPFWRSRGSTSMPYRLPEIGAFEAGARRRSDRDVPDEVINRVVSAFKSGKGVQSLSKELAAAEVEPYGAEWTCGRVTRVVRKELGVASISDLRSDYPLERRNRAE